MTAAAPVDSPCIGVCSLADGETCAGCHRTRAEIKAWRGMTDDQKRAVNERVLPLIEAVGRANA